MAQVSSFQFVSLLKIYSFDFSNLPSRLKCILCNSILKNSKQTSCGCKACEKFIKNYLSNGPKPCPNNQPDCAPRLTMEDIHQDNATNGEIGNLTVNCPFEMCKFLTTLKHMSEHFDKCEFREIECEQCGERIPWRNKKQHDNDSCEMRNVNCKYCNKQMTFEDLHSVHLNCEEDNLCSKYVNVCPNNCAIKERVKLKEHLKVCPNRKLICPFHSLKCKIDKMTKRNLKTHFTNEIIPHFSSLVDQIKQLEMKIESLYSELFNLKLITEHLHIQQTSSNSLQFKNLLKGSAPIEAINEQEPFRNGNFIWKFTNFEKHKIESTKGGRESIMSDPFYTSEFGYKICLKIYPGGDGEGKGTYLSVFFGIMKGEYDDILSWPFKQKVTLTIFDLKSGIQHYSETLAPDIRSDCYQKPVHKYNKARGSPQFIELSKLKNNSIYCRNDTIYIKISVDPTGMCRP